MGNVLAPPLLPGAVSCLSPLTSVPRADPPVLTLGAELANGPDNLGSRAMA